jgi:hypothetical protein
VSVVYVLVIFGGGYFIRALIGPLWKQEHGQTTKEHEEVINAGLYIGWLERFLVLTALFLQSPATVHFIFAAKSIARYPGTLVRPFRGIFSDWDTPQCRYHHWRSPGLA